MRIFLPPPSSEKLKRLEAAAAARPRLYAARLALLALIGDVLMTFVRAAPVAGPIAVGALFVGNPQVDMLAAAAIVLLIWLMRPGIRSGGRSVARQDAPEMYRALDALKNALDVGGRIDVRLDDDFNAGAREARGLFGIADTRRVLTLGVPLLALFGEDEARAVIAHEFGHFSRRHGRFGHWLYWAHLDWLSYAGTKDDNSSILERGGATLAQLFAPVFSRRAMVWSRRCEYEADADAARTAGAGPLVSALVRSAVFTAWHAEEFPRTLHRWQRDEATPPDDFMERLIAAFDAAPSDLLAAIAATEAAHPSDWNDTHPVLGERAAALGVSPRIMPRGTSAGPALLGSLWPAAVADYNARWRREHAVGWSAEHARWRLVEAPLLAAAPDIAAGWPVAQRLDRAMALLSSNAGLGLAELDALQAAAPGDRSVTFACAAAHLAAGDAAAVKVLSALAREDASWRVPAYSQLADYCNATGDRAGAGRWSARLRTAHERAMRSLEPVYGKLTAGEHPPTTRPASFIAAVHAGLAVEPAIATAWLVEARAPLDGAPIAPRVDALIITVDPFDARQQPFNVDAIKGRQRTVLAGLIEPDALTLVASFYTTEVLPPALSAALERYPPGSVYRRDGAGAGGA